MLFKIAWRNVWRNKRRSLIVLVSIVVGVTALILNDTLSIGWSEQMLNNQIGLDAAHLQISRKGYHDDPTLEKSIPNGAAIDSLLKNEPLIRHYSERLVFYGLVSSSANSSGITIVGIQPKKERNITTIHQFIVEGQYLDGGEREILISRKLAQKLAVDLGEKVVILASRPDGKIGSEVFRVSGLFQSVNADFDKSHIYIPIQTARRMMEVGPYVSQFAVIARDFQKIDQLKLKLRQELPDRDEVMSYREILPLLVLQVKLYDEFSYITYFIVGLALIFGIINTMLMAVMERIHEFGVLKSIGMPNGRIFRMILYEALLLGVTGMAFGMLCGYLLYLPLSHSGLDLSQFASSLASFGTGAIIYPVLKLKTMINVVIIIPLFAVGGAIYPAYKAVRFVPVEALRYV